MTRKSDIMVVLLIAGIIAGMALQAASADRINPPEDSIVVARDPGRASETVSGISTAIASESIQRILAIPMVAAKTRSPVVSVVRDPAPVATPPPSTRRIVVVGSIIREDGVTVYWFRDLAGTAIYPLVPNGESIDGWRLKSVSQGIAVVTIDGDTFLVKEK